MKKKKEAEKTETVLEDNKLVCLLTDDHKKISAKEKTLQSLIRMMNEEYGFELTDMERDIKVVGFDENDKKVTQKVELAIYKKGKEHNQDNLSLIHI